MQGSHGHMERLCVTARVRIVSMGCLWTAKAHIKSSKLFQFKLVRGRPWIKEEFTFQLNTLCFYCHLSHVTRKLVFIYFDQNLRRFGNTILSTDSGKVERIFFCYAAMCFPHIVFIFTQRMYKPTERPCKR